VSPDGLFLGDELVLFIRCLVSETSHCSV